MQFSRVYPPHVFSTVFFGRPGNTQESTGTQHSLPEHKGKHLSLEFGLLRLIRGLHITIGKVNEDLHWFMLLMQALQTEVVFAKFFITSEVSWRCHKASENILGNRQWTGKADCGHYKTFPFIIFQDCRAHSLILPDFCSTELRESQSLLDSSFRIMQWWEMGSRGWESLVSVCVSVCLCEPNHLWWMYLFKMSSLNFKQDAKHVSEDKNDYFHNLLKHKKAI